MSEKSVREVIDKLIENAGWKILRKDDYRNQQYFDWCAIEEYPTDKGFADYALFIENKIYAIIEVKTTPINSQNVLEQAKRYAYGCTHRTLGLWNGLKVPFLYSTNGEQIWFADVREANYYSRQIKYFHTPEALKEMFERNDNKAKAWLRCEDIQFEKLRNYQKKAIRAIEEALIRNERRILVAMATGTGKTFTMVASVYRLLKSGLVRRVLFLVDRRALAAQAAQAFASFTTPSGNKFNQEYEVYSQRFKKEDFENEIFNIGVLPNQYLTNPTSSHAFVYISTIQRMAINLFGREEAFAENSSDPEITDEAEKLNIPIHAFDLIIADECHRGYTSKDINVWRNVLDHFDAIKIGLTATPAAHTVAYFNPPIFKYSYEQAVLDGYLADYRAIKIKSDVRINGVFLRKGETVDVIDPITGASKIDTMEDEREFNSTEIEMKITAPDSNRKILEEIKKYAEEHEQKTGRFPKTLIFAVHDLQHTSHCDQIVKLAREIFGRGDDFVQKITGNPSVDRPLEKIRHFRNRPTPGIVVTVDMLSTGVDIPPLEFIVFMRPVKSRILWAQMLGRGTRKCPDINKEYFTIFDCFDGTLIEYFRNTTDFNIEIEEISSSKTIPEIIDDIWNNIDREYNIKRLIKRMRSIADTMSGEAREQFAKFIPEGDINKFVSSLQEALKTNFIETMKLLKNKDFQELLQNYPRAKKVFYVAHHVEDNVVSEILFNYGDKNLKPLDYLEEFSKFIKENKNKVEPLKIIFESPSQWCTKALKELRNILKNNKFDEQELQKAIQQTKHKAMADIISIVKHAANQNNPLLTAQERVEKAIAEIKSEFKLNNEQLKWLDFIKEHLVVNLALDKESFDIVPILEQHGGLAKARKIFGEKLEKLIESINFKLVA